MVFARKNVFEHDYEFIMDEPIHSGEAPIIKVIGVGGGGSNAVNHMFTKRIKDVEFVVCNTDKQALMRSPIDNKIQLGADSLKGLGAGTDWVVGREAAVESIEYIRQLMQPPTQMVFITAGMGGGTGTGAAPIIAQVAKDMGMLTVAVVTATYKHEGKIKKNQAIEGINALKEHCDTVLVILNDELAKLYGTLPILRAYEHADNVLTNAVKSIAEIITVHGSVNSDFMDVKKVLKDAGTSVMSSALAKGSERAKLAIEAALNSPLLNNRDIRGAERILITLASSTQEQYQATLDEQMIITDYIEELIGEEADMCKVGVIFDESLDDQLLVTVIAAGFEDSHLPFKYDATASFDKHKVKPIVSSNPTPAPIAKPVIPVIEPQVSTNEVVKSPTGNTSPPLPNQVPHTVKVVDNTSNIETLVSPTPKPTPIAPPTDTKEDLEGLRRQINDIVAGKYAVNELEIPAYLRQNIVLYEKPTIPQDKFVYIKLDKHKF
ncbi:MAG: cell division protein FtsZ [Spirosomataceae bacterium]